MAKLEKFEVLILILSQVNDVYVLFFTSVEKCLKVNTLFVKCEKYRAANLQKNAGSRTIVV